MVFILKVKHCSTYCLLEQYKEYKSLTCLRKYEAVQGDAKYSGNYRPIACLNIQYKFTTAVLADSLAVHVEANGLLPEEQCALKKGARGCVNCLAVDKVVITDARFKGLRTLRVGWIDFKKAYDRVPHEWLITVLDTIHAPGWVRCHSWLPSFNVEDSNGGGECATDCKS